MIKAAIAIDELSMFIATIANFFEYYRSLANVQQRDSNKKPINWCKTSSIRQVCYLYAIRP